MTLDRLAFGTLVLLALCVGLGDIASVTSIDAVLLTGVRGLLPLGIALALLATVLRRRLPAFPSRLAWPALAWLSVLVISAALAPSNRLAALASLERPASGALLAWAVYSLCRTRARWHLLAKATALSGLAIALAGLAEATGISAARDWLATLHDGAVPIGDVPRIASTLSHPNEAAMLLELSLPLLVAWAWTASRRWRVPLALAALSNLVAMVLTFSRAGVVAGMAGLAVMAGLCVVRGERRPLLSLSAAVLAVPAALICAAMADEGLDRRLTAELSQDSTVSALSSAPASALSTQPAGVTAQQISVKGQPPDVTAPQTSSTGQPAGVTPEQGDVTDQPAGVTAQQTSVTAQPPDVTAQQTSVTAQPPGVTAQQTSVTAQPPGVTAQQTSVTAQPAGVTAQQTGVTAQQTSVTAQPAGVTAQQTGVTAQPAGMSTQPALGSSQPSRMEFWSAAITMFRDHPWLGVGPDNFRWRFASYSGVQADNLGIHAHDQYLEALADTGVLGLLSLSWLLVRLVQTAVDGVRRVTAAADWPWRAAILASLTAWLLHALLDDFERFWPASVAFWLLAGLNLRLPNQPHRHDAPGTSQARSKKQRALALVAALLITVGTVACSPVGAAASAYPTISSISHKTTEDSLIHIESPGAAGFVLGDFFAIWGLPVSTRPRRSRAT